ncbi:MAG: ABC-2 transporter permease [Bacillota bacterium]
MWRLIGKDIRLLRSTLLTQLLLVGLVVGATLLLREQTISFFAFVLFGTYSLLIVPLFVITILTTEEKNRGLVFLRTLPLRPGTIVAAKYLGTLILAAAWAAIISVLARFLAWAVPPGGSGMRFNYPMLVMWNLPLGGMLWLFGLERGFKTAQNIVLAVYLAALVLGLPVALRFGLKPEDLAALIFSPSCGQAVVVSAVSLLIYSLEFLAARAVFARKEL